MMRWVKLIGFIISLIYVIGFFITRRVISNFGEYTFNEFQRIQTDDYELLGYIVFGQRYKPGDFQIFQTFMWAAVAYIVYYIVKYKFYNPFLAAIKK